MDYEGIFSVSGIEVFLLRKQKYDYNSMKGKTFGKLYVIDLIEKCNNEQMCLCRCECGTVKKFHARNVATGKSRTCGFCRKINYKQYINSKFGNLTVLEYLGFRNKKTPIFLCKCTCGIVKEVNAYKVIKNEIVTCNNCKPQRFIINKDFIVGYDYRDNPFYIDIEDFAKVSLFKWSMSTNGYFKASVSKGVSIYLHRYVMSAPDNTIVDHIDFNKSNCRKQNLRLTNKSGNTAHSHKRDNCISKYKGVTFDTERCKWIATITKDQKCYYLGRFENEKDAAIAYNKKAIELHGEFAFLNNV